jgi:hypothetical protein
MLAPVTVTKSEAWIGCVMLIPAWATCPPASAWIESGSLLRRRSAFGHMDFARHFRDPLIALETSRAGATLVTENMCDFERWKAVFVSVRKTLKLFNATRVNQ